MTALYPISLIGLLQRCLLVFIIVGVSSFQLNAHKRKTKKSKSVVVIHDSKKPKAETEALLILPGLGDTKKGRKMQKAYFMNIGYDLFIPDYTDKESFDGTVEKLRRFYEAYELGKYKKVHVFSYILGSWVINTFILKYGVQNIATIVYDRSPLQERAPRVVQECIPKIGKMVSGQVLADLSLIPYPPIPKGDIRIGILVESKATPLIRRFKKTTMSYGPIDWNNLDFKQEHDDLLYTRINHDEMYYTFDEIGPDIKHFLKVGSFTKEAKREPFDWDPFEKYKEKEE